MREGAFFCNFFLCLLGNIFCFPFVYDYVPGCISNTIFGNASAACKSQVPCVDVVVLQSSCPP